MSDNMFSFVFDVDGTLCPIKGEDESYADLVPYADMVEKLREYKAQGARIILYTSRNMRTYGGDVSLILEHTKPELEAWLAKWDIPYDEIVYGKLWPGHRGLYVDDRSTTRPTPGRRTLRKRPRPSMSSSPWAVSVPGSAKPATRCRST